MLNEMVWIWWSVGHGRMGWSLPGWVCPREKRGGRARGLWTTLESFFPPQGTTDGGWSAVGGQGKLLWLLLLLVFVLRKELFAANLLADGNDPGERGKPLTWKTGISYWGDVLNEVQGKEPRAPVEGLPAAWMGPPWAREWAGVQRHLGRLAGAVVAGTWHGENLIPRLRAESWRVEGRIRKPSSS